MSGLDLLRMVGCALIVGLAAIGAVALYQDLYLPVRRRRER